MKDSNDVLTPTIEQEQIDTISNLVGDQLERAKIFNQEIAEGKKTSYVWAAIDFSVSFRRSEGFCAGWIHYHDGRRLNYYGKATRNIGLPAAQKALLPAVLVLPYEALNNSKANYYASGYALGGGISLTWRGAQVSPLPWPTGGWGIRAWSTEGVGKFTAA